MVSLYSNTADGNWAGTGTLDNTYSWGPEFVCGAGTITGLKFFAGTGTWARPSNLRLFRVSDSSNLSGAVAVPTTGPGGWETVTLTTPITVAAATPYRVAGQWATGQTAPTASKSVRGAAPSPLLFSDFAGYYTNTAASMPNFEMATAMIAVDVVWAASGGGGGDGGATPGEVGDELAKWLSSDSTTQTHETDGLPWLTKAAVDSSRGVLDALTGAVANITTAVGAVITSVGHLADAASATGSLLARTAELLARIPANILTSIADLAAWVSSWFGDAPRPEGTPTIPEQLASTFDQLLALRDQVTELEGHVLQLQAPLDGFPTDFELASEFEFIDCLSWPVAADVYVLHVTTVPRGKALSPVCGVNMIHHGGWWAPLADTLPSERHYLDFEFNLIAQAGGRIPGILVELGQDGAATIQAWNRLPPPIGPLPVPPIP